MKAPGPVERTHLAVASAVVGGFVLLFFAWRGVARTLLVPLQTPWVISAGFTGVLIVVTALGVFATYEERRAAAARLADADEVLRQVDALVTSVDQLARARRGS